jgi:hypothetical protein
MSLELALQQNTAAINTLIELLSNPAVNVNQVPVNIEGGAQVGALAESTKTKETKKAEAPAAAEAAEPATRTYDDVSAFIVQVGAKLGKTGVVQVLNKFGAEKNLKEVDPSNWAGVIEACKELLA